MNRKRTDHDANIESSMDLQSVCYRLRKEVEDALWHPDQRFSALLTVQGALGTIQDLCRSISGHCEAEIHSIKPWRQGVA